MSLNGCIPIDTLIKLGVIFLALITFLGLMMWDAKRGPLG